MSTTPAPAALPILPEYVEAAAYDAAETAHAQAWNLGRLGAANAEAHLAAAKVIARHLGADLTAPVVFDLARDITTVLASIRQSRRELLAEFPEFFASLDA